MRALLVILFVLFPLIGYAQSCFDLHKQNYSRSFKVKKRFSQITDYNCDSGCTFKELKKQVRSRKVNETNYVVVPHQEAVIGQFATVGFEKSVSFGPGTSLYPEVGHFFNIGVETADFYDSDEFGFSIDVSWAGINTWMCEFNKFCDRRFGDDRRRRKRCERQFWRVPSNRAVVRRYKGPKQKPFFQLETLTQLP